MNLAQWQTKPCWSEYEAELLGKGYVPCWDPETEQRITAAGITCCKCRAVPTYVGMTNGTTELGFLACPPECGEWIWFVPPLPPDGGGSASSFGERPEIR